jgi:hypothetical protein
MTKRRSVNSSKKVLVLLLLLFFGGVMGKSWIDRNKSVAMTSVAHHDSLPVVKAETRPESVPVVAHNAKKRSHVLAKAHSLHAPSLSNVAVVAENAKPEEFQAGSAGVSVADLIPALQVGFRLGSIAPNWGMGVDLTAFPIRAFDHDLVTRFSFNVVPHNSEWLGVLSVNELAMFKTDRPDLSAYVGAGANLPLTSGGELGYNFVLGVEQKVAWFEHSHEAVFFETGLNSYRSDANSDDAHVTVMIGYKFAL